MPQAIRIALLGAESTGKSQLAQQLAAHFVALGHSALAVDEHLRQWCDERGRTPERHEQAAIAQVQAQRIDAAAAQASIVLADTTMLTIAVHSDYCFTDTSLYAEALAQQRGFDITLLMGLDLPWVADGIQRDGAHVRGPVDSLIRAALQSANLPYQVIYGRGQQRLHNALAAIETGVTQLRAPSSRTDTANDPATDPSTDKATESIANYSIDTPANSLKTSAKWAWTCEKCSDADCEHRLFTRLTQAAPTAP